MEQSKDFRLPESGACKQTASLRMFSNLSNLSMGMWSVISILHFEKNMYFPK